MAILTTADRFRHELEKLLLDEIERLKDNIALGFLENYSDYQNSVGMIAGLRSAYELLDLAERKCNGEEGNKH